MNILISGGRIVDPKNNIDQIDNLFVQEDKVATLGKLDQKIQAELASLL